MNNNAISRSDTLIYQNNQISENEPQIIPDKVNLVDSETRKEISKKYPKYKKLENKTGVPWKVLASIDQASSYPLGIVSRKIQNFAKSKNLELNPETDSSKILDVVRQMKTENPKHSDLIDRFTSYYIKIDEAYL